MDPIHCDDAIHHPDFPECLRYFLLVERLPAVDGCLITSVNGMPKCFATYKGKRVRLVMASRFGDVGITRKLDAERGYDNRVGLHELSDFSEVP